MKKFFKEFSWSKKNVTLVVRFKKITQNMSCFKNLTNNRSLHNDRSPHNVFKNINYNVW